MLRNRNSSFVLDGEAVLLGVDGRSDFDALHSRRHDAEVELGLDAEEKDSLNGRAALKLMQLDGARCADQAASDARVTKSSSSIAVALVLISSGASATECQSSPGHDGKWWSWRTVDFKVMLVSGQAWPRSKDLLHWARQSPPPVVTRPDLVPPL